MKAVNRNVSSRSSAWLIRSRTDKGFALDRMMVEQLGAGQHLAQGSQQVVQADWRWLTNAFPGKGGSALATKVSRSNRGKASSALAAC